MLALEGMSKDVLILIIFYDKLSIFVSNFCGLELPN